MIYPIVVVGKRILRGFLFLKIILPAGGVKVG